MKTTNRSASAPQKFEIEDLDFEVMPPAGASVKWGVTAATIATIIIIHA